MSAIADEAVTLARGWIGTPYRHQASVQGAGTDCLGLLRGVWRGLYGGEPEPVPAYTADWSEPEGAERLWSVAKHLGISAARDGLRTFIHAYSGHGVVESALTEPWERRIVARFEFPERMA